MSVIKELAGDTVVYGFSTILSKILHFVLLTPYLTRVFSDQAEYGKYSDLYAYAAFLLILFTYRMETGYFRFGTKQKEKADTIFTSACSAHLFTTTLFVALIIIFRSSIAGWLDYESDQHYISYFAAIIGLDALVAIPFARLRLQNKAWSFALIKLSHTLFNLCLVFFFLEGCPRLIDNGFLWWQNIYTFDARLDLIFLANLLASASVALYFLPQILSTSFSFSWPILKKLIKYSSPLLIVGLAGVFNQSSAVPLIKYILSGTTEENLAVGGIYGAVAKLAVLMNLFTVAFNYAAEPLFFRKSQDEDAKFIYAEIAQAFALVASAGFLFIILFLDLFQYLIGPEYRSGLYVVPILLLAYWFLGLYYNFSVWYKVTDKTHYGAWIAISGSITTLVIALLFLKSHGILAMAVATLACYAVMAIAGYLTGQRHYPVPYPIFKILGYLILAIVLAFCGQSLENLGLGVVLLGLFKLSLLVLFLLLAYFLDKKRIRMWLGL